MPFSMHRLAVLLALVAVAAFAMPAEAADAALWAKLKEGGHVALVRHAQTPGGVGDPEGFRLDDCSTQRNLNEEGRAAARELGGAHPCAWHFRRQNTQFAMVPLSRNRRADATRPDRTGADI